MLVSDRSGCDFLCLAFSNLVFRTRRNRILTGDPGFAGNMLSRSAVTLTTHTQVIVFFC